MTNKKRLIDIQPLVDECDECMNIEWNKNVYTTWAEAEEDFKNRLLDAPTVDPMEFCIQEVLGYIDRAFDRQRYDSKWLDEKGEIHSADVGYGGEWWEDCMKPELLRMFSNVGAKTDGDGNA